MGCDDEARRSDVGVIESANSRGLDLGSQSGSSEGTLCCHFGLHSRSP
jgi:hypothetical protein